MPENPYQSPETIESHPPRYYGEKIRAIGSVLRIAGVTIALCTAAAHLGKIGPIPLWTQILGLAAIIVGQWLAPLKRRAPPATP